MGATGKGNERDRDWKEELVLWAIGWSLIPGGPLGQVGILLHRCLVRGLKLPSFLVDPYYRAGKF